MTKEHTDSLPSATLSSLSAGNLPYVEDIYRQYLEDPNSVDEAWASAFKALAKQVSSDDAAGTNTEHVLMGSEKWTASVAKRQSGVLRLINAYRSRGHQAASIDPIGVMEQEPLTDITLAANGLTEADLDTVFDTGSLAAADRLSLRDIISLCEEVYCSSVGIEYMYLTNTEEKRWIQARVERIPARLVPDNETRKHILERITAAEGLEKYLHTKYVGQKRFSLEGGESLIPMLSELIQRSGSGGVKEVVIGMAHRGRLNVLVNILGKSPKELFGEFEGVNAGDHDDMDSGDVKYHQGFSSDIMTPGGAIHLAMSFNPSHLEIIDAVVEGSVRARQHRRKDISRNQVIPILLHGDAAFAGQGVVMETLNMSQARGYSTGGTVHIVINNQIGFTTSNRADARSTMYCTEVAKMVQAPIFHVNGDDPDAVFVVTQMALDYRMEYNKDVVIDLVCYRRLGHNEADEPSVTQPFMYKQIKKHPTTRQIYADKLVKEGVIDADKPDVIAKEYREALDDGRIVAGQIFDPNKVKAMVNWRPYIDALWTEDTDTHLSLERIQDLNKRLTTFPQGFELHARVKKIVNDRIKMTAGEIPMDWGFAETMAYAALVEDGYTVRLSGQDSGRGTFFHRHATIHNQANNETLVPLRDIGKDPNQFLVINSLLSEEAVLGFEYGYATTDPDTLVVWEAQFGDFANGAQVVIDQFISSGEAKWRRLCGLVMLLPHGYEGQGPEHSSARLERFLQLCAEHNMQVCMPTTPAQMFHMLRRQMMRKLRRPLVVMSPKSLLRHKLSVSTLQDLTDGHFQTVIDEIQDIPKERVERVILCSGKVYFELHEERISREQFNTALVRVEQLHPFPKERLTEILANYKNANTVVWCQEEPKNQGSWYQISHHLKDCLSPWQTRYYAGREASAAPAVGFYKLHLDQTARFLEQAFTLTDASAVQSMEKKVASNAQ
ncbi:MAG: 2-oxoglutarate dehydrogenase subunit E1 [marine bacterium B5-7]|nr:MAG: 2-oxoglutarate dehydrogenase subunit E1 [marine bacterium B5-7]